jgi:acyl carrier protein
MTPMTRDEITNEVVSYLAKLPGWAKREASGQPSTGLIEHRVLDSVALLEFVSFVEKLGSVDVPSEDITEEHFDSVDRIVRYVMSKRSVEEA